MECLVCNIRRPHAEAPRSPERPLGLPLLTTPRGQPPCLVHLRLPCLFCFVLFSFLSLLGASACKHLHMHLAVQLAASPESRVLSPCSLPRKAPVFTDDVSHACYRAQGPRRISHIHHQGPAEGQPMQVPVLTQLQCCCGCERTRIRMLPPKHYAARSQLVKRIQPHTNVQWRIAQTGIGPHQGAGPQSTGSGLRSN